MRNDYDEADVRRLTAHLADQIAAAFPKDKPLNIVGIRTRGEVLAVRLTELLAQKLSITALSQQSPLPLMLHSIPCDCSRCR